MKTLMCAVLVGAAAGTALAEMAPGEFNARDLTPVSGARVTTGAPIVAVSEDGKTVLPIVYEVTLQDDAKKGETWRSRVMGWTAGYLQDYIIRMTGAKPKMIKWRKGQPLPVEKAFFVGEGFIEVMPDPPDVNWKEEEFAVEPRDGSVWFVGEALHGVCDFCERILGVREYFDAKDGGLCLKKTKGLEIPLIAWTDRPCFRHRINYPYDKTRWSRMLKNTEGTFPRAPALQVHAPYGRWFADTNRNFRVKCPEIFQLDSNGERNRGGELCYGNPKTLEVYKQMIDEGIATGQTQSILDFATKSVTVSQRDDQVKCHCEYCKKLYRPELAPKGDASPAIWGAFVRPLSDWLAAAHPDWTITILPYINTEECPAGLSFPSNNVLAEVCATAGLASFKSPQVRVASEKRILDWRKATGRPVRIWHYSIWPAQFTSAAYVYGETIVGHYRRLRKDIEGTMINGPCPLDRNALNLQVWMRALWNPDVDPQGVYDGFCTRLFGPAAKPMRAIVALEEKCWNRPWKSATCSNANVYKICYPRKDVEELLKLFAEAEKLAADDPEALKRVLWYKGGFKDMFQESEDLANGKAKEPVRMQKVADLPKVDGVLDEDEWKLATPVKFVPGHTYRKVYKANPEPEFGGTEMRAVWNRTGIVFGFRCAEKSKGFSQDRPLGSFENETFDMFFDPSGTGEQPPRQLVADPQGTWAVCEISSWKAPHAKCAFTFDAAKGEYCAEVFVPFDDLRDYAGGKFPVQTANGIRWVGNITRWRIGDPKTPKEKRKFEATRVWTAGKWENDDSRAFGEFMFVE